MKVDEFSAMPLEKQRAHLDRSLRDADARDLLALCSELRDHAPLAFLCERLALKGWLREVDNTHWFAQFLVDRPETAVHRVLRTLTGLDDAQRESSGLSEMLLVAMDVVPLSRLTSMCVMDRALKHNFQQRRDAYHRELTDTCVETVRAGQVAALKADRLVQLNAENIQRIRQAADDAGGQARATFEEAYRAMASAAIAVLRDMPKGVSQANAEELLSSRVYTDPGHFLIELLQNAEDSGATIWKLHFSRQQIVVWHDGEFFSARDVVGVTSIGQTTKRKQQIGFFGVGFKSVYEITQRPQIYSDVFQFEIADVSIPKALRERPAGVPAAGTVLVLPLKHPNDKVRSGPALFEKARALDPCVLYTLRGIREIHLTLEVGGRTREHHIVERPISDDILGQSQIEQKPDGWRRHFLIRDADIVYKGGDREAGRPDRTRVMVGVSCTPSAVPKHLEASAATVYSYLPTDERSGLRFFIQGHFDVPVDRERITPDSAWNRWILSSVPAELAKIARSLVSDTSVPESARTDRALGLLEILPQHEDLSRPIFNVIPEGLARELREIPLWPCTDGALHAIEEIVIAKEGLTDVFGGTSVPRAVLGDRLRSQCESERVLALAPVSPRVRALARALGCPEFGYEDLVEAVVRSLEAVPNGGQPDPERALPALVNTSPPQVLRVYESLLTAVERLEDSAAHGVAGVAASAEAAVAVTSQLATLPLVYGDDGGFYRAPCLYQASTQMRRFVGGLTPLLHSALDRRASVAARRRLGRVQAFLNRLELETLDEDTLLASLVEEQRRPIDERVLWAVLTSAERLDQLIAHFSEQPVRRQKKLATLPVFRASDGVMRAAALDRDDLGGVVLAPPGERTDALRVLYGGTRPLLHPKEQTRPAAGILERLRTPELNVALLAHDLAQPGRFARDLTTLRLVHRTLEIVRDELTSKLQSTLAKLDIWPDRSGVARSLKGKEAVRVPIDDAVCALFPDAPFLDRVVAASEHLTDFNIDRVGAEAVVRALSPRARPPLRIQLRLEYDTSPASDDKAREDATETVSRVHAFLLDHTEDIGPKSRERLMSLAAFNCDRGQLVRLGLLCHAPPTLREVYADTGVRHFVALDSSTHALVEALELGPRLTKVDVTTLVGDLSVHARGFQSKKLSALDEEGLVRGHDQLLALFQLVATEAEQLSADIVRQFLALPLFPDESGGLWRLGDPSSAGSAAEVYPCMENVREVLATCGLRLLDPVFHEQLKPLFDTQNTPLGDARTLVELLRTRSPGLTAEQLAAVQTVLVDARDRLAEHYHLEAGQDGRVCNPILNALQIWRTRAGSLRPASELVAGGTIEALFPEESKAGQRLAEATLPEDAHERLEALAPLLAPADEQAWLSGLIGELAEVGKPLEAQPAFLSSVPRIVAVLNTLEALGGPQQAQRSGAAPNSTVPLPVGGRASTSAEPWTRQPTHPVFTTGQHARVIDRFPLVDARGHLTFDTLCDADEATRALVLGGPLEALLIHVELRAAAAAALPREPNPIPEADVLAWLDAGSQVARTPVADHPWLSLPSRRLAFYGWLTARSPNVFSSPECLDRLRSAPLFPTERGNLLPGDALVVDPDLPDLGIDWTPHEEVPEELLTLLGRHLGGGRPALEGLLEEHLLPAYHAAVARPDAKRAGELFQYLSGQLGSHPPAGLLPLLEQLPLENAVGDFRPPQDLILPQPELAEHVRALFDDRSPSAMRYRDADRGFLHAIGVHDLPPTGWLCARLNKPLDTAEVTVALAAILGRLYRDDPAALPLEALPLKTLRWMLDGAGNPRRPDELFAWTADIETYIGPFPHKFPDRRVQTYLGDTLLEALGLRGPGEIRLEDVVDHIVRASSAKDPLPFQVYRWLERGLEEGWLDPSRLKQVLSGKRWVRTDGGDYYAPTQTIGTQAFHFFGDRRGYWERGRTYCPRLCELFGIAGIVSVEAVIEFLREIGEEVGRLGDQAVLSDTALPRMLLACYAHLGRHRQSIPADWPAILCTQRGGETEARHRLMSANEKTVLRSDTPTLERLFAEVGTFCLVAPGSIDERPDIDTFYEKLGVRRLRDAYRVEVDPKAGRDISEELSGSLQTLRAILRALSSVLPRVRTQRTQLSDTGWVFESRLAKLVEEGDIRAFEALRVRYVLDGVGMVSQKAEAVYDHVGAALVVDSDVATQPRHYGTGLAAGLLPCVYDGPGESQLADIIEILLPFRDRASMDDYLDRRHFPVASAMGPTQRLAERLDEIVDFGLGEKLDRRFPELAGRSFDVWRGDDLKARLARHLAGDGDSASWAASVSRELLEAIELHEPSGELVQTIVTLLTAPAIGRLPWRLFAPAEERQAAADPASIPTPSAPSVLSDSRAAGPSTTEAKGVGPVRERPLEIPQGKREVLERFFDDLKRGDRTKVGPSETTGSAPPLRRPEPRPSGFVDIPKLKAAESAAQLKLATEGDQQAEESLWRRFRRFLGWKSSETTSEADRALPDWAARGANPFSPTEAIESQFWATPENVDRLTDSPPSSYVAFFPPKLPAPWSYAIRTLADRFDAGQQRWLAEFVPSISRPPHRRRAAVEVALRGRFLPGEQVLPLPMFSTLLGSPEILDGEGKLQIRTGSVTTTLSIEAEGPLVIGYRTTLLEPPPLTGARNWLGGPAHLTEATALNDDLAAPVHAWIRSERRSTAPAWQKALAARTFVQQNYVYDRQYLLYDGAVQCLAALPQLSNQHLRVLHASSDAHCLGRGVCYELNILLVELLRRLDIPAMVATGWVLDEGRIAQPDHLFAVALLQYDGELLPVPLDASTGPDGAQHTLAGGGSLHLAQGGEVIRAPSAAWGVGPQTQIGPVRTATGPLRMLEAEVAARHARLVGVIEALREIRHIVLPDSVTALCQQSPSDDNNRELEKAAADLLGDPHLVAGMERLLRGDFSRLTAVPDIVQRLVHKGLAEVESVHAYRVVPAQPKEVGGGRLAMVEPSTEGGLSDATTGGLALDNDEPSG